VYFNDILIYSNTLEQHIDLSQVYRTSRKEKLYVNPKNVPSWLVKLYFLRFVLFSRGFCESSKSSCDSKVAQAPEYSWCKKFSWAYNYLQTTPITDCLQREFLWPINDAKAFREIKHMITESHVIRLPDFSKVFEVAYDASDIDMGRVLSQEKHALPISVKSLAINLRQGVLCGYAIIAPLVTLPLTARICRLFGPRSPSIP